MILDRPMVRFSFLEQQSSTELLWRTWGSISRPDRPLGILLLKFCVGLLILNFPWTYLLGLDRAWKDLLCCPVSRSIRLNMLGRDSSFSTFFYTDINGIRPKLLWNKVEALFLPRLSRIPRNKWAVPSSWWHGPIFRCIMLGTSANSDIRANVGLHCFHPWWFTAPGLYLHLPRRPFRRDLFYGHVWQRLVSVDSFRS